MRLRTRARLRWQGRTVAALTIVWLLLWGHLNLVTLLSGIVLGYLVSVVFPLPAFLYDGKVRPIGVLRLLWQLFSHLVLASFDLASYSLRRTVQMRPGVVRIDLTSHSDLVQVMTAALVSLVPGTIVVDAPRHERRLYLHVFDLKGPDAVANEVLDALGAEVAVLRAFGSSAELERAEANLRERRLELRKESA